MNITWPWATVSSPRSDEEEEDEEEGEANEGEDSKFLNAETMQQFTVFLKVKH